MKANLAHGRIAGIPATGGYVTLEQADATSLVNATSGLVREVVNSGLKVGAAGLGLLLLERILSKSDEDKDKDTPEDRTRKAQAILNTEPTHWGGICLVSGGGHYFHGILLNDRIKYTTSHGQTLTVPPDRILTLTDEYYSRNHSYKLTLIDGSVFTNVNMGHQLLEFATLAGVIEVRSYTSFSIFGKPEGVTGTEIKGVSRSTLEILKSRLAKHLKKTSLDAFEEFGLDLVRKYFHVEITEPEKPLALPTTTAVPRLEVALMEISRSQRIATKTLPEGQPWTVAFGEGQSSANTIFGKVENVAPYSFRLLSQAGFLRISGSNIQVISLLVDGQRSKTSLTPTGDEWVLDCRQQSHVVVVNGNCMLHICPRSS